MVNRKKKSMTEFGLRVTSFPPIIVVKIVMYLDFVSFYLNFGSLNDEL